MNAEYEQRMKAWRDRSSEIEGAAIKAKMEVAWKMKFRGIPLAEIVEVIGLF